MQTNKYLISIVGPTAVGKTSMSISLARHYKTEIISADSRQFYKEMSIGTAKPTTDELALAKHHFIDTLAVTDLYSVGQFETDALAVLDTIFQKKDIAIMVGGSGLYLKVVQEGLDEMPEADQEIREELNAKLEKEGLENLVLELENIDPEYYKIADKANPQRILRALEVYYATGKPYSSFRKQVSAERPFKNIKIGLTRPREELYAKIEKRVDLMLNKGLLKEAMDLMEHENCNALQTVGYQELFGFFKGEYDLDEAINLIKRNSRRYAKRQITWFGKDKSIKWFEPKNSPEILRYIDAQMK